MRGKGPPASTGSEYWLFIESLISKVLHKEVCRYNGDPSVKCVFELIMGPTHHLTKPTIPFIYKKYYISSETFSFIKLDRQNIQLI